MEPILVPEEYTVLCVDDEADAREQLGLMIAGQGYRVVLAENGQQGLEAYRHQSIDIVVSDIRMPVMNGLEMAREIRRLAPSSQIIILTAFDDSSYLMDAIEIGISHLVLKPLQSQKLSVALTRCRDTIHLQRLLTKQHEQIRMLSNALEQSPTMALITATDGTIEYVNRKFSETTGYASCEVIGNTPRMIQSGLTPQQQYEELWSCILAGHEWRGILRNRKRNGDIYWESCSISPLLLADGTVTKFIKTSEDITERRKLEAEAQRSRHLQALSILAGGMAHDFNNLLQVILGSISLARTKADPGSTVHGLLEMAERSSGEARTLSRKLLELVREGEGTRHPTAIAPLIRSTVCALAADSDISLSLDLCTEIPLVEIDESRFRQLVYHLTMNAIEAMPSGGALHVRTDTERVINHDRADATEDYVQIIFSDTGRGIAPDHLERIFEPYFSTKGMGSRKGQGLGLAICHSVVDQYGGMIAVESEQGNGTTFKVWLPAAKLPVLTKNCAEGTILSGPDGTIG